MLSRPRPSEPVSAALDSGLVPARPVQDGSAGLLQRLRLRWLVLGVMLAGICCFLGLAVIHPRAAPLALAGALLIAVKGLGWLLVLRHYRVRLRRSGFRW